MCCAGWGKAASGRHQGIVLMEGYGTYLAAVAEVSMANRKLKVELVAPDGKPLKITNEKGKELKYTVVAREGYTAKHTVE